MIKRSLPASNTAPSQSPGLQLVEPISTDSLDRLRGYAIRHGLPSRGIANVFLHSSGNGPSTRGTKRSNAAW